MFDGRGRSGAPTIGRVVPSATVVAMGGLDDVVVRLQSGDADAVRDLYDRYGRSVFAVAMRILGRRDLADDATQQTFVQAWQHAASLDPTRDPGPWLHTVARRSAIGLLRREHPERRADLDDAASLTEHDDDPVERTWQVWQVRQAVDALPPDEREAVRLTSFDGFTHAEVAERLDIPIGTVKSRMGRAYKRLAAGLDHVRAGPGP